MAFYNEFPHTRNYDDDLRELIDRYNTLNKDYDTLVQIYEKVQQDIKDITIEQLQQWLDDGTLESIIESGLLRSKIFLASDYCTADGNTDNTADLQRAINESAGYTLIFDAQSQPYRCSQLTLKSNTRYLMEDDTVIKANDNWITADRWQDPLIDIRQVHDVYFNGRNGTITQNRTPSVVTEHAHCLGVRGGYNVHIKNVNLTYANGDGLYIDQYDSDESNTAPKNVTVDNVNCFENERNGMSIISGHFITVKNSTFRNTNGTAPQSGLVIEGEDRSTHLSNIVIENCYFTENMYSGLVVSGGSTNTNTLIDIAVFNCLFDNEKTAININNLKENSQGTIYVNNCMMNTTDRNAVLDSNNASDGCKRVYENCRSVNANGANRSMDNNSVGDWGWGSAFQVCASSRKVGNATFKGCSAIDDRSAKQVLCVFSITEASGTNYGAENIKIIDCINENIDISFMAVPIHIPDLFIDETLTRPDKVFQNTDSLTDSNSYFVVTGGSPYLGACYSKQTKIIARNINGTSFALRAGSSISIGNNITRITLPNKNSYVELASANQTSYYIISGYDYEVS